MKCEGSRARGRLALVVLCLASFMAVADSTIVSVALPSMRRELSFPGADAQWVLTGYALAFGGLLLVFGRAGDLYGRRLLFCAGLGVFGVVSLLGGFAPSAGAYCRAVFLLGTSTPFFCRSVRLNHLVSGETILPLRHTMPCSPTEPFNLLYTEGITTLGK